MKNEDYLIEQSPSSKAFYDSPKSLRPHFLHGEPKKSVAEVQDWINENKIKGQSGITLHPSWNRWDDPDLFTEKDEYWESGKITLEEIKKQDGYVWIYDEPGYPSGTAGMLALHEHPELQQTGVVCVWKNIEEETQIELAIPDGEVMGTWIFDVKDGIGNIGSLKPAVSDIREKKVIYTSSGSNQRFCVFILAKLHEGSPTHMFREALTREGNNTQKGNVDFNVNDAAYAYPNFLDKRSTERFIEVGYEPYERYWGQYFGEVIRAFFTDEPTIPLRHYIEGELPGTVPWCEGFEDLFKKRYGYEIRKIIPALFFDFHGYEMGVRCDFYNLISDLFAENFVQPMTQWCKERNMYFTGHFLHEEHLVTQMTGSGSILRAARQMSMPGIDNLSMGMPGRCVGPLPSITGLASENGAVTPKMLSSAAHLGGWVRTMSESHGWSSADVGTTFSGYVATANWQMVLGINTLPYYCMDWIDATEEQRKQYTEYAGRLSYMTTGGLHKADVAVIYPMSSIWALFTPMDAKLPSITGMTPEQRESWQYWSDDRIDHIQSIYDDITRSLLARQMDFDFVEEQDVSKAKIDECQINIVNENFKAIVLPGMHVISVSCLNMLEEFRKSGGVILVVGEVPKRGWHDEENAYVLNVTNCWDNCENVIVCKDPDASAELLKKIINRDVMLTPENPSIYVMHKVKESSHIYFIVNNSTEKFEGKCTFSATGSVQLWNAWDGKVYHIDAKVLQGKTEVQLKLGGHNGCFIVIGDSQVEEYRDEVHMWDLGPLPQAPAHKAEILEGRMREHYFGKEEISLNEEINLHSWELYAPRGDINAVNLNEQYELRIPPWRRLGWVIEGLECSLELHPGVYILELEAKTENLPYWAIMPRHYGEDDEIYEKGFSPMQWRNCLSVLSSHDWTQWKLYFRVPEKAISTKILIYPCCKELFSKSAEIKLRNAKLVRVISNA